MTIAVAEAIDSSVRYMLLDVAEITESRTNPRKRFDATAIAELALSIAKVGILEPLIVRPHPVQMDGYELIAGARRLRAAQAAGLLMVPCLVRTLDDREALEVAITENLQRENVHPLDEADGYAALLQADGAYTVEGVAARFGKSTSYVYQRLKLRDLTPEAREAFELEEITAAHAVRLARLTPADQAKALNQCFYGLLQHAAGAREVKPVSYLDDWIADHTKVDVTDRATVQHYLPDLHEQLEQEAEPETLLALSTSQAPGHYLGDKNHGVLGQGRWKAVKSATACAHTQRGVIVHGAAHRVLWVCAKKACAKHWPTAKKAARAASTTQAPVHDWKAEQAAREKDRAAFAALKPYVLAAVAGTLKDTPLTDDLVRRFFTAMLPNNVDADEFNAAVLTGGFRLGTDHVGALLAFALSVDSRLWEVKDLKALCKNHRVDFKALEKEQAADADAGADAAGAGPHAAKGRKAGRQ